jgi:hypothetical protein
MNRNKRHHLYKLNIIAVIKERGTRWAETMTRIGYIRNGNILFGMPEWKRSISKLFLIAG